VKDWATLVEREAQERVSRVEAENATTLAFGHEDAKGLVQNFALLEGELTEACLARELAQEDSCSLSTVVGAAEHWWEVS
jgi:hypothetical protein